MKKSYTWKILQKYQISNAKYPTSNEKFLKLLLENRGFKSKKDQDAFLHPDISQVTPKVVGIDVKNLAKAIQRIQQAVRKKEQIVIYGDYDVDGIAGTAILWETLYALGAQVTPYIPSRTEEGYGLSSKGISNIQSQISNVKLIITVDNGIVANEAVDFANKQGIDVIITDHHTPPAGGWKKLPQAYAIVHTTELCGTGVAYLLSREIISTPEVKRPNTSGVMASDHLALVALAVIADLVPINEHNRPLLVEGLKILRTTSRPGIISLCEEAAIKQSEIGVYEIGHVLAPRLNAMGRIASAMDSLRLLCTTNKKKAKLLATSLGVTNKDRQLLTQDLADHAILSAVAQTGNILFVAHETYDEGVIGLVAGKLVEKYYRPAIVVSIGREVSKASARSISGFNVIEFIRDGSHLLINAGGHPMAAGFTIATERIEAFRQFVKDGSSKVDGKLLSRTLTIDCELPLEHISQELYNQLQSLAPFGMNNPEPTFVSKAVIQSIRTVGKENTHLKLRVSNFDAIGFGLGELIAELQEGQEVQIVYTIDENIWNNKKSLQLKIKDIKA